MISPDAGKRGHRNVFTLKDRRSMPDASYTGWKNTLQLRHWRREGGQGEYKQKFS
jgi:hypothetical protein